MIISKMGYPRFWDHIVNPPLGCIPALLKPHARGQLTYSNFKIWKSNTQTNLPSFSKYCINVHPYIKILDLTWSLEIISATAESTKPSISSES